METDALLALSLALLVAAFGLGAVDGVYFHLQRFQLFAHSESRLEHGIHTVRAWLALPTVVLLYLVEPYGAMLVAAALVVLADQVALVLDLIVERRSRARLGGLPHAEYMIHVGANGLHTVAMALALALRPLEQWTTAASGIELTALPAAAHWLATGLAVVTLVAAVQHVWLLRSPSPTIAAAP